MHTRSGPDLYAISILYTKGLPDWAAVTQGDSPMIINMSVYQGDTYISLTNVMLDGGTYPGASMKTNFLLP